MKTIVTLIKPGKLIIEKLLSFLFVFCFTGTIFALQTTIHKLPPTMDNSSIRKSERVENRQTKEFQSRKSYSSMKTPRPNKSKKRQSKGQDQGKGL